MNDSELFNFGASKLDYIIDDNINLMRKNKRSLNINN